MEKDRRDDDGAKQRGWKSKRKEGKRLAADNVRVMAAPGYFYILGDPLKANVRDNSSAPAAAPR